MPGEGKMEDLAMWVGCAYYSKHRPLHAIQVQQRLHHIVAHITGKLNEVIKDAQAPLSLSGRLSVLL